MFATSLFSYLQFRVTWRLIDLLTHKGTESSVIVDIDNQRNQINRINHYFSNEQQRNSGDKGVRRDSVILVDFHDE